MIGVGFRKKRKITLEASYDNGDFDTAVATGESLARHSKGEVVVYLYFKNSNKVKILKRIKMVHAGFLWLGKRVVTT